MAKELYGWTLRAGRSVAKTAIALCVLLKVCTLPAKAEDACEGGRLILAQYEKREVEVTYEAHDRLHIIPTTYRTVTDEVVLTPAHCPGETLRTVTRVMVLEEPSESLQFVPATFELVTDDRGKKRGIVKNKASVRRVTIPPHPPKIRITTRDPEAANNDCAREDMIPAKTRLVERRVVDTPASTRSERVPETVRTITEKVLIAPARCERED